jgi:hypothetical protein
MQPVPTRSPSNSLWRPGEPPGRYCPLVLRFAVTAQLPFNVVPHIRTLFCYVAHVRISSKRTPRGPSGGSLNWTGIPAIRCRRQRVWNLLALGQLRANTASIQNNCEFRLFCSRHQVHAFSKPNPRKPAFPYIDPANCKTHFWNTARPDRRWALAGFGILIRASRGLRDGASGSPLPKPGRRRGNRRPSSVCFG